MTLRARIVLLAAQGLQNKHIAQALGVGRGGFKSLSELVTAIDDYVAHHNTDPKPFSWTKSARDILQKVIRANACLSSKQSGTMH